MRRRLISSLALLAGLAAFGTLPSPAARPDANGAPGRIEMTDDGPVLVTSSGMTLYMGSGDASGRGACTNQKNLTMQDPAGGFGTISLPRPEATKSCLEMSPPYLADAQAAPQGPWTTISRADGSKQWAYQGRPLHLSIKDKRPGDRNGSFGAGGAGLGGGAAGGVRMAVMTDTLGFPPIFELTTLGDDLVVGAKSRNQPVYTPKGKFRRACNGCESFQPILAPAMAKASGDWSIVDAGAGRKQYAYKGKPVYSVPDGMSAWDVDDLGDWEPVVFRKGSGTPPEIGRQLTLLGEVYTDKSGKTLYTFSCAVTGCDLPGGAARYWVALCSTGEECAKRWHPYLAPPNAKPVGRWSVVDVAYPMFTDQFGLIYPPEVPRVKAWAYRGSPVYTYYLDKEPRDFKGHMIRWTGNRSQFTAVRVPGRGVGSGF